MNYLVECRFDEACLQPASLDVSVQSNAIMTQSIATIQVYASNSFRAEMLAMRASIGTVVKQTPLAKGKDWLGWVGWCQCVDMWHGRRMSMAQDNEFKVEFKVETILRLPVTRSTLETESLELAAVDGRGGNILDIFSMMENGYGASKSCWNSLDDLDGKQSGRVAFVELNLL